MRSGIGPADHLRAVGIDVVHDLPGVGSNLHDHPFAGVVYAAARPVPPARNNHGELVAAVHSALARLADDARVDGGWLRQALGALVDTGALRLVRSGPVGTAEVDVPTIADHARFRVLVGSRIVTG